MINSKIARLFKSLTLSEKRSFRKYIKSPVFNKNVQVLKLFDFLDSRAKISRFSVERAKALSYMNFTTKKHRADFRKIQHLATLLLLDFVRKKEQEADLKKNDIYLLRALIGRNLKKDAFFFEEKQRLALPQTTFIDANYYLNAFHLEQVSFELITSREQPKSTNIQKILDNNANFFVINTLRYACASLTHQNLFKTEKYKVHFLEAIIQQIEAGDFAEVKSIQLYYACYQTLFYPKEEQYFTKVKNLISSYKTILSPKEFRDIYNVAINYCIKQLNAGNTHYIKEGYNLYMQGIESKALIDNEGYLSRFAFKNIVALGLNLGYMDTIHNFLSQKQELLHPDFRKNYIQYNWAKYYFSQKNYHEAERFLIQTDFNDLFINLDAKMMLLKIYVETELYNLLEPFAKSFLQFLRRQFDMGYHLANYTAIVEITVQIARGQHHPDLIKQRITITNPLTEKKWLFDLLDRKGIDFSPYEGG